MPESHHFAARNYFDASKRETIESIDYVNSTLVRRRRRRALRHCITASSEISLFRLAMLRYNGAA